MNRGDCRAHAIAGRICLDAPISCYDGGGGDDDGEQVPNRSSKTADLSTPFPIRFQLLQLWIRADRVIERRDPPRSTPDPDHLQLVPFCRYDYCVVVVVAVDWSAVEGGRTRADESSWPVPICG